MYEHKATVMKELQETPVYRQHMGAEMFFSRDLDSYQMCFQVPFDWYEGSQSLGHIWTGLQYYLLWESNPHRGDSL